MAKQTVFLDEKTNTKLKVITQQYVTGLYVAVYIGDDPIPDQTTSRLKENDFHRKLRKKKFIESESSEIPVLVKVVFRKFRNRDKEVIALFPEVQADDNRGNCQSFMHIGQHGAAAYSLVDRTAPAKPEEYADLEKELISRGYELVILKRIGKRWWNSSKEKP